LGRSARQQPNQQDRDGDRDSRHCAEVVVM
jgi:hypothetical protein